MGNVISIRKDDKPDLESSISMFLKFKGAEGKSDRTIRDYTYYLEYFFRTYPNACDNEREARSALLDYLAGAKTPSTHNLRLQYLRVFFRWLWEEGIFTSDVTYKLKKQKNPGKFREIDSEILRSLLSIPDRKTYAGYRDYCLIMFTIDTATRPGEALSLTPSDLNLKSMEITIPAPVAKTRISRTIPISPQTCKALTKLLSKRHPQWTDDVPLFASSDGLTMLETSWGKRMRTYSKRLGVKIIPYLLRHSSATLFLRNGGNAIALQRMMGHTSMEMTERYVHLVEGDIRKQHEQHSAVSIIVKPIKRVR